MKTLLSLTIALACAPALALDIVSQDITVDMSGETLLVTIDAHVDGGGELPIYALAASATASIDDVAIALEDDTGEYAGLVQWLSVPDGTTAEQVVRIVVDGRPSCLSAIRPGFDACTFTDS